jgi:hypothetical protein
MRRRIHRAAGILPVAGPEDMGTIITDQAFNTSMNASCGMFTF